jgi:hypothetical protein
MNSQTSKREAGRTVISLACETLCRFRRVPPAFPETLRDFPDDCYVLLRDATQMYCAGVSEGRGENPGRRWSESLPKMLFEHPELWRAILEYFERKDFQQLTSVHLLEA